MTTTTTASRYTPEMIAAFEEIYARIFDDGHDAQTLLHEVGATEHDYRRWLVEAHPVTEKF